MVNLVHQYVLPEHNYKLANIFEAFSNDDGPWSKHRVEGKEVKDLEW